MQSPSYLVMSGGIEGKKMGVKDMGGGNYYGFTLLLNYKIWAVGIFDDYSAHVLYFVNWSRCLPEVHQK